jgi:hypothetical protein
MNKSELRNIIREELLKEQDGVKYAWKEAKKIFPKLNMKKTPHHDLLITLDGKELITFDDFNEIPDLENQITTFLKGMIMKSAKK